MAENERLQEAFGILGYQNAREPHHRSNLVLAIQLSPVFSKATSWKLSAKCKSKGFVQKSLRIGNRK